MLKPLFELVTSKHLISIHSIYFKISIKNSRPKKTWKFYMPHVLNISLNICPARSLLKPLNRAGPRSWRAPCTWWTWPARKDWRSAASQLDLRLICPQTGTSGRMFYFHMSMIYWYRFRQLYICVCNYCILYFHLHNNMILCLMIVIISIDRCILEQFGGDDHSHHRGSVNLGDQPVFLSTWFDRWTCRSSWKGCKTVGYHCPSPTPCWVS